ncbi:hypothetical protein P3S67_021235 [Capsicum chacoense]
MSYIKNNNLFFLFMFALDLALVKSFEMHIVDALPNGASPLTIRCLDKDHDLGTQRINVSEEYKFTSPGGTLYTCYFYWNGNHKIFNVNDEQVGGCDSECYWKVQEDGFYFARRKDGRFGKLYPWN